MDRRNMLKKFLVSRTAFVNKDGGSAVAEQHSSTAGGNEAASFAINWHAGDDHGQKLTLAPAEDWFQTDGELYFRTGNKAGFLQGLEKAAMQNACDANVMFRFIGTKESGAAANGCVGFSFGADTSDSSNDKKLMAGITSCGHLYIGDRKSRRKIAGATLKSGISLNLSMVPQRDNTCWLRMKVLDKAGKTLDMLKAETDQTRLFGGICIVVQADAAQSENFAFAAFRNVIVQQKQIAASVFNSRPLHPDTRQITDITKSFHHPYKITE